MRKPYLYPYPNYRIIPVNHLIWHCSLRIFMHIDYKIFTISLTATDIDMWIWQNLMIWDVWRKTMFITGYEKNVSMKFECLDLNRSNVMEDQQPWAPWWSPCWRWWRCWSLLAQAGATLHLSQCDICVTSIMGPNGMCTTWSELSHLAEQQRYFYFNSAQICRKFQSTEN